SKPPPARAGCTGNAVRMAITANAANSLGLRMSVLPHGFRAESRNGISRRLPFNLLMFCNRPDSRHDIRAHDARYCAVTVDDMDACADAPCVQAVGRRVRHRVPGESPMKHRCSPSTFFAHAASPRPRMLVTACRAALLFIASVPPALAQQASDQATT